MIPLDKVKIDSFRFYLPLSKVIVNSDHSEFMRKITRVNEDGEILSEELKLTHFNKEAIVSPKYEVIRQFGNAPDIAVSINSKFLLSKYFTGINKETVDITPCNNTCRSSMGLSPPSVFSLLLLWL